MENVETTSEDAINKVVETKEVTKGTDDKWKYEFKGLPKYENGKEITYSIDEEKVEGYGGSWAAN